ncbi:MAG: hypothetical protein HYW65_02255 [Candidatus Liptonbacteria bacterium]|nr:hypothetical protein [Candidatus Liptonbacteria bacterium]
MKLITISGPRGTGIDEILKRVREAFPGTLHVVERNGYPIEVVEDGLIACPRAIIEATPGEVQKLHLFAGKKDAMFRIFVSAEREMRAQRLRAAFHGHDPRVASAMLHAALENDPTPLHPYHLRQPIFDLIAQSNGEIEGVSSRVIRAVGRFLRIYPVVLP